jgi:hypothetical protein
VTQSSLDLLSLVSIISTTLWLPQCVAVLGRPLSAVPCAPRTGGGPGMGKKSARLCAAVLGVVPTASACSSGGASGGADGDGRTELSYAVGDINQKKVLEELGTRTSLVVERSVLTSGGQHRSGEDDALGWPDGPSEAVPDRLPRADGGLAARLTAHDRRLRAAPAPVHPGHRAHRREGLNPMPPLTLPAVVRPGLHRSPGRDLPR